MATNVDQLRAGLKDYNQGLDVHIIKLQEDFESLMEGYFRLKLEYEGQAAEEFQNSWERTAAWFMEYTETARNLSRMLEERIDSLSQA